MNRILIIALVAALVCTSYGAVIGNWETGTDGWTSNGTLTYGESVGVTLDDYSAKVELDEWGTALKLQFGAPEHKALFMQNDTFSIDFSVAANDGTIEGGWTHLQKVIMNNGTAGWKEVTVGNPQITYYWWPGSGERTTTLTIDYSAYLALITDINPDGTGGGYLEIIIETQTGGGAPTAMYFDNAVLTPEPMTIALLGLGGLMLRRRK